MTVIAAIATGDQVVMGCDIAADHGGTTLYLRSGKIARMATLDGKTVLIGASGHASMLALVRRDLAIGPAPKPGDIDDEDRWADAVAGAITELLANANPPLITPAQENAASLEGNLLLAHRTGLWVIQTHHAIRPRPGIAAIGSGRDLALGSMYADTEHGACAEEAVQSAVNRACRFDSYCGVDQRGPLLYSTTWDASTDARLS